MSCNKKVYYNGKHNAMPEKTIYDTMSNWDTSSGKPGLTKERGIGQV